MQEGIPNELEELPSSTIRRPAPGFVLRQKTVILRAFPVSSMSKRSSGKNLINTSRQVQRSKDDLPRQINDIPQILIVYTKRDRVPP
jgi:hypothetical protein